MRRFTKGLFKRRRRRRRIGGRILSFSSSTGPAFVYRPMMRVDGTGSSMWINKTDVYSRNTLW